VSAHQLRAQGVDVVVASYETYENNDRAKYKTLEKVTKLAARKEGDAIPMGKRPTCGLASDLGYYTWHPWKRVILDEVQYLKNWDSVRHKAVARISTQGIIGLSGTLPHNRWLDLGAYLDFIKGHPYTDQGKFLAQFIQGSYDNSRRRPSPAAMSLLQRLFMAFTIIRPRDSIKLPPCRLVAFELKLPAHQAEHIEELTDKYRYAAQMYAEDKAASAIGETAEGSALGCAIQAQLHQLHPGLTPVKEDVYDPAQDVTNITAEELNEKFGSQERESEADSRAKWVKELGSWSNDKVLDSAHLTAVVDLVHNISVILGQKVVVFSQYLRYLDLVDLALRQRQIGAFRYDGTVPSSQRSKIQEQFSSSQNTRPILMTVGAGGIGLNLTAANVMILCEELWNDNAVAQVIARLHRQGQTDEVLVLKFGIPDSAIDLEIVRVRETKVQVNADLLKPLIVRHDAQPTIPKLLF
jgi:SNF2 family DNA or RNA helicase